MKSNNILKNKYLVYGLILIIGLLLGWLIFGGSESSNNQTSMEEHSHSHTENEIWTCSMHPQIKQDKQGKCPICAMDLIPLKTTSSGDTQVDDNAIQMSNEAVALANIQTTTVSRENPIKGIQLYGTIQADERQLQSQSSYVNGRIENLFINFTGETVRKGQTIATIYSPDLLNAQQELLEAQKMKDISPMLLDAAREKLRLWKLSDSQIEQIENTGVASPIVPILANTSGIIVGKNVSQGDYVNQGSVLFNIANLSQVWAMFDAYESDLPFLNVGDKVEYTVQAIPGKTFSGKISFINPIIDPSTRTAKVRVETPNTDLQLKPEMYANANIEAPLKHANDQIVVPKSAVLWTGKRSIVYLKQKNTETPAFLLQEVELGPSLGSSYVILSGLHDGDEIVTNGVFTVDASAQLEGKKSMMNNEKTTPMTGHEHHNMDMSAMSTVHTSTSSKTEHTMIDVGGACDMCKERIETAAKSVKGVTSASWDADSQKLHLNFDPSLTNIDAISKAIAKVGHDTDLYKADQAVYDALPGCCHYRK